MSESSGTGVLPMRPLTVGELLDTALVLLRTRAWLLLGVGLVFAAAEQAVLYPLRQSAGMDAGYFSGTLSPPDWLGVVATGFGTEAFIIAVLGGFAAAAALPALVGRPVVKRRRSRAATARSVAALATVAGLVCGLGAFAVLPWFLLYPFIGLATPVAVIDQKPAGRALLRSMKLVAASGLRPGAIRLLGYGGWVLFRFAFSLGATEALNLLPIGSDGWPDIATLLGWMLVNALAYPVLGCLDAVLHLEARMRIEGLDIALAQALRRNEPVEQALAAPGSPERLDRWPAR